MHAAHPPDSNGNMKFHHVEPTFPLECGGQAANMGSNPKLTTARILLQTQHTAAIQ